MTAANISVTSTSPEELAAELAIATAELAQAPTDVRVNGASLVALTPEAGWDAPRAWRLSTSDGPWTIAVLAEAEWHVLDIFGCVDRAEQVDGVADLFIAPVGTAWIVAEGPSTEDTELTLQIDADGVALWRSRDSAMAAARRFARSAPGRRTHNG